MARSMYSKCTRPQREHGQKRESQTKAPGGNACSDSGAMESGTNSRDSGTISESSGEESSLGATSDSGGMESCSSTRRSRATDSGAMTIESGDKEATASGDSESRASGKSESMART
uniref:Uncharacterized protein n=1 Tax=Setaria viridis TaxID=4556 RepID=A0A4U6VV73_SETVI|nr:hypothetical protein SEVIR_2G195800v2 [Setaria viridis]